ncbi:MAG: redoxin domain-containing protein [Prolixibacteraceae bacterium]
MIYLKNFVLLLVFVLLNVFGTQAAGVKISGKAPEYANNRIALNTLHDFISEEKTILGMISFDDHGNFSFEIEITQTSLCFADFDGYHGMIYLEPGKSYELLFPPKRTLTASQKRNPFAKPEPVWFGLVNPDKNDINLRIQHYEQSYTTLENKYFDQIFINKSKSLVDTVKTSLDHEFPKTNSEFFESHKFFRKGNLEFALNQGKSADFMRTYFSTIKPVYNLAAYSTLFNQVFLNYFNVLTIGSHGAEIKKLISNSNLKQLDEYFQMQLHFNPDLAHLVLLKSMKDAYYNNQFSRASVLKMLELVKSLGWSEFEKQTATLISSKLTYLASGTNPPEISLKNPDGRTIKLSDFRNTYIYLHFTDPQTPICRQHLDALKTIATHYKEKLTIINVIQDQKTFRNENNWAGIFTTTSNDPDELYKVKTFPTSYLIGKDGKLLLSPAPNPIDGLDRQLGQILKSDYFKEMQQRNKTNIK